MDNSTLNTITVPVLPLRGVVVFPHSLIHFDIGRQKSISAINVAMEMEQVITATGQVSPVRVMPQLS